ncbi:uncharacterized protein LOC130811207 [Amaranthus tricolor]|uniref:uncharacterized protein LOC130811207 n=1 Tax=Amaranthus tricolor TaxID=29722 RepID=UPI002589DDB8|nr:uncharacterized protein LOC130811207 [Amaranthus tricolor]
MILHQLRRTLISLPLKHELSNLTIPSSIPFFSLFSTFVNSTGNSISEVSKYLITQHDFSKETALKSSIFITQKKYETPKYVISFFKNLGVSNTQLEAIVLCDPQILSLDVKNSFMEKIDRIKDLGFSNDDLVNLLSCVPGVLTLPRSVDAVADSFSVLLNVVGVSNSDVIRVLKNCNWYLGNDLNKSLVPNIKFLENCGISQLQIRQTLFNFPRFYLQKPESIRECARRVDEMGLSRHSKIYIHGVRVMNSMSLEKWESKVKLFRDMGYSEDDIVNVFRKVPQVFALSEKKILLGSEVLLSSGSVDLTFLIQRSELLIYSAGSRIKPRLDIIKVLMSKNLLQKEPSTCTVYKMSDKAFIHRYVLPYADEIGEVGAKYIARRSLSTP